jgi:ketosteroid isomerase-like protein
VTTSSTDEWEIHQVVERYASAADRADGDAVAAVFTDDGELEIWMDPTSESRTAIRRGPAEIAAAIRGLTRYRSTHHTISSSVATVDGDHATGETRCEAHHVEAGAGEVHDRVLFIRYDDTFARVDGRWRIARRELHVKWIAIQPVESI